MRDYAVAHGIGQVQILEMTLCILQELDAIDYVQGILLVPELSQPLFLADFVQEDFSRMSERSVAQVVSHGDGIGQFGIQSEETGNGAADRYDVVHMFDPGADAVIVGMEKDLRLGFETGVGQGVEYAAVVAVEFAADFIGFERGSLSAADGLFPMRMPGPHGLSGESVPVLLDIVFQGRVFFRSCFKWICFGHREGISRNWVFPKIGCASAKTGIAQKVPNSPEGQTES